MYEVYTHNFLRSSGIYQNSMQRFIFIFTKLVHLMYPSVTHLFKKAETKRSAGSRTTTNLGSHAAQAGARIRRSKPEDKKRYAGRPTGGRLGAPTNISHEASFEDENQRSCQRNKNVGDGMLFI